jgi:hypothetical protein
MTPKVRSIPSLRVLYGIYGDPSKYVYAQFTGNGFSCSFHDAYDSINDIPFQIESSITIPEWAAMSDLRTSLILAINPSNFIVAFADETSGSEKLFIAQINHNKSSLLSYSIIKILYGSTSTYFSLRGSGIFGLGTKAFQVRDGTYFVMDQYIGSSIKYGLLLFWNKNNNTITTINSDGQLPGEERIITVSRMDSETILITESNRANQAIFFPGPMLIRMFVLGDDGELISTRRRMAFGDYSDLGLETWPGNGPDIANLPPPFGPDGPFQLPAWHTRPFNDTAWWLFSTLSLASLTPVSGSGSQYHINMPGAATSVLPSGQDVGRIIKINKLNLDIEFVSEAPILNYQYTAEQPPVPLIRSLYSQFSNEYIFNNLTYNLQFNSAEQFLNQNSPFGVNRVPFKNSFNKNTGWKVGSV